MTDDGLLGRVRTRLPSLPSALRRVATQVVGEPGGTARSTIIDLAERSGTSTATVTRFCRLFGYRGYAELRLAVATESGRDAQDRWAAAQARWDGDIGPDVRAGDKTSRLLGVVAGADARAVRTTAGQLDLIALGRVVDAVAVAGRVEVFGAGSSGSAAAELAFRLQRIRVHCWHRTDAHSALSNSALLGVGDVAIGLSHQGRTRDVIEMLGRARSRGALTVAVTSLHRSPVARAADVVLTTAVQDTTLRLATVSALHSQLLVLDLVYVAVAQRTYPRTAEALEVTARAVERRRTPLEDA